MTSESASPESQSPQSNVHLKKRRLQKSCDSCRKRKIRCRLNAHSFGSENRYICTGDSANIPDGKCTNCTAFNTQCTHTETNRKRGPKNKCEISIAFTTHLTSSRHVEELKQQLSALEARLRSVHPEGTPDSSTSVLKYPTIPPDASPEPGPPLPEDDLSHDEISERFRQFSLGGLKHRFFGSSSGFNLVKNVIDIKEGISGSRSTTRFRRPEFWMIRPWEIPKDEEVQYKYPAPDLQAHLLQLYFTHIHPVFPVLHQPTFERSVAQGLHYEDFRFGAILLAVCAVASRYSDDPRVLVPGYDSLISAGWIFFEQVQLIRKSLFDEPSLYEVQLYCLGTLFSLGTSSPQASWLYLGLGVRFLQERGEHRRRRDNKRPIAESESWKRAFWCLLFLDRTVCSFLGRPTAIHVEDYDVELPLEVDDEYWESEVTDKSQAWKQPEGKPSKMTYFSCLIRLCEILGSTLRRLYASKKSRILMGLTTSDWEQRAVSELDSALNLFLGSLPDHLRWDAFGSGVFFDQSTILYVLYHQIQITIHRPYINKPTVLAFPSLAICTSAARSCIHVADVWVSKQRKIALSIVTGGVFVSAVLLLLNMFAVKRSGMPIDVGKELAHVHTAMAFLKFHERRWQSCGRLWEMLQELQTRPTNGPSRTTPGNQSETSGSLANPVSPAEPASASPESQSEQAHRRSIVADMCPTTRAMMEQAAERKCIEEAGMSIFAQESANVGSVVLEGYSPPQSNAIPHPPTSHYWADVYGEPGAMPAQPSASDLPMDQLYTLVDEPYNTHHQWPNSVPANMLLDENFLSMWSGAPTDFGNIQEWNTYIENRTDTFGPNIPWPIDNTNMA
ncbi:unnamed protein product [Mycena citricolor]|uniref:Zn(2)-C6 fungal-type domain-containing protein n=1 Tax=Mycena citricolor TaxID=2018698 RepID=A0AAD2HSZ5_9AGAR|nr:unnamed protein product [Mycena citricolor]